MSGAASSTDQAGVPTSQDWYDYATSPDSAPTSIAAASAGVGGDALKGAAAGSLLGPVGTVVGGIAGAAVGIWGAITGADDQAKIDQEKAQIDEAQAAEVAKREAYNDAISQETIFRQKLEVSSSMAEAGHAGGSIGTQLEVQRQGNLQIMLNDESAQFQEQQLLTGAQMQQQLAGDTELSGTIRAIGAGISGATKTSGTVADWVAGSPQRLPSIGGGF